MKLFRRDHKNLPRYGLSDVGQLIRAVHGEVDPSKLTVLIPIRNERPLIPAFLTHYRSLGYEQFIWLDDDSDDGSFAYLEAQEDCIIVHATMRYGDELLYTGPRHNRSALRRFGVFAKMALPHFFLPGQIVAYFDADEFLILPPNVTHIREVYDRIDALGSTGAYASMVEFFPRSTEAFDAPLPDSFDGLMQAYGWFEGEALFDPTAPLDDQGKPVFSAPSKTMRLFEDYAIGTDLQRKTLREKIYLSSKEKRDRQFNRSARHKTPILRCTDESFLFSSHDAIQPPNGEILLTIAHFVFTASFAQKIENARSWKSHAKGAAKYTHYAALLKTMDGVEDGFLTERSRRFTGPEDLIEAGVMKW